MSIYNQYGTICPYLPLRYAARPLFHTLQCPPASHLGTLTAFMDCYLFPNKPGVGAAPRPSAVPKYPGISQQGISATSRRAPLREDEFPPCCCHSVPPLSCSAQQAADPHASGAPGVREERRLPPPRPHTRSTSGISLPSPFPVGGGGGFPDPVSACLTDRVVSSFPFRRR